MLAIRSKIINTHAYINLLRFSINKFIYGFEKANLFLQRVDKESLQLILKNNGATIGSNCDIETGLVFHNCKNYSNLRIGNNCHIGKNCFFDLKDKIVIKDNVVISMQCTFITHTDLSKSELSNLFKKEHKGIVLNRDVYIGARSTVLMGVELQECCFIAAGCLVNKDIVSYGLAGGVPVKILNIINGDKIIS